MSRDALTVAPSWRLLWHSLRCAGRPGAEPYPRWVTRYSPQTGRTECSVCGFLYSAHPPLAGGENGR